MDSNNMNQNQQLGESTPDNAQSGYYQNTYTNANYQQAPYNNGGYQPQYQPQTDLEEPVTIGEWVVSFLIMMVPCVNIVMMFVWAFGSGTKKSKSNFFKMYLIFTAIVIVLLIALFAYLVKIGAAYANFYFYH